MFSLILTNSKITTNPPLPTVNNERLAALTTGDTTSVSRIRHLGGYAEPFDQS